MNELTISLPNSLHSQLAKLAEREGVSVDQLATSALTEKVAALLTTDYLVRKAQRGSRSNFEQALNKVKDTDPLQEDAL